MRPRTRLSHAAELVAQIRALDAQPCSVCCRKAWEEATGSSRAVEGGPRAEAQNSVVVADLPVLRLCTPGAGAITTTPPLVDRRHNLLLREEDPL